MVDYTYDNLTINHQLDMKAEDGQNFVRINCKLYGMYLTDATFFVSHWIKCLKSISAYGGFIGTDTDWTNSTPENWIGGGAILMGYGLEGPNDPPRFILTRSSQPMLYLQAVESGTGNKYPGHLNMGMLTTKEEAQMCYNSYYDPHPYVPHAIKIGDYGIAVNGDSKFNDTLDVYYLTCKYFDQYFCEKSLSGQMVEKKFKTSDDAISFLTHEMTKDWFHITYGEKDGTIVCTCGKEQDKPCPEHKGQWEDKYCLKSGDIIQANAMVLLNLLNRVINLEGVSKRQ